MWCTVHVLLLSQNNHWAQSWINFCPNHNNPLSMLCHHKTFNMKFLNQLLVLWWEYHTTLELSWNKSQVTIFKKSRDQFCRLLFGLKKLSHFIKCAQLLPVWEKMQVENNPLYWPSSLLLWPEQVWIPKPLLYSRKRSVFFFFFLCCS